MKAGRMGNSTDKSKKVWEAKTQKKRKKRDFITLPQNKN